MKIELWLTKDRAAHILAHSSGLNAIVIKENTAEGMVYFSFEIADEIDALRLFHSGVRAGMESMSESVKKLIA